MCASQWEEWRDLMSIFHEHIFECCHTARCSHKAQILEDFFTRNINWVLFYLQLKICVFASPKMPFISAVKTFGSGLKVKVHYLLQILVTRAQKILDLTSWHSFVNGWKAFSGTNQKVFLSSAWIFKFTVGILHSSCEPALTYIKSVTSIAVWGYFVLITIPF